MPLRRVFGPMDIDEVLDLTRPASPIDDIDLNQIDVDMQKRRGSALYVDSDGVIVRSPLDEISDADARIYVRLAIAASNVRRWIHGSQMLELARYLEFYRAAWLRQGGDQDWGLLAPDVAAARWKAIGEEVFAAFTFVAGAEGYAAAIAPVAV